MAQTFAEIAPFPFVCDRCRQDSFATFVLDVGRVVKRGWSVCVACSHTTSVKAAWVETLILADINHRRHAPLRWKGVRTSTLAEDVCIQWCSALGAAIDALQQARLTCAPDDHELLLRRRVMLGRSYLSVTLAASFGVLQEEAWYWVQNGFAAELFSTVGIPIPGGRTEAVVSGVEAVGELSLAEVATAAGWHPDPYGRYERRFWDGAAWTEHVWHDGALRIDPVG